MKHSPSDNDSSGELRNRLDGLNIAENTDGTPILRGQVVANQDLSGLDFSGMDLSRADLTGCDLSDACLVGANLTGAKLCGARLDSAEFLDACLQQADLAEATGKNVGFARADLRDVNAVGAVLTQCSWSEARMVRAIFGGADLRNGRFREADLALVEFVHADLRGCDLTRARLGGTNLKRADLRGATMSGVRDYQSANWIGAKVLDVDFHGAYLVRRHLMDVNYLHEFRQESRIHALIYWIWWITSDCGRSLVRWTAWVIVLMVGFALAYLLVDIDYGEHETPFSPLYYSIVTLTTLGYGDAVPASMPAQMLAVSEAILGYIGLGGLLSIFAQKMARRAD